MKNRLVTLLMLLISYCFLSEAAPNEKFGTTAGKQLVTKANDLYKKKKYTEAKVLYEQVLEMGDQFYANKCREQLRLINGLTAKQSTTRKSTVFTISQDTVRINYLGGDYPIHVNGEKWSASTPKDEDWCKIDIDRRTGLVKISTSQNVAPTSRSTTVTIKNGNGQKKTVLVINDGAPEILRSSAKNLTFTPDGETSIVDIDANTDWAISDVPHWLDAIKGNGDIQFTAGANTENKDRIAHVKVETPSRQEITINIFQSARLDSLAFSKNDLDFGPDGGDEYIKVYTNAEDWKFGSFPHWCQLERIDNNTIKVHCTPNEPVDMPREASINVTTGTQTLGVNVYQAPKPIFNVIPQDGIGGRRISFGFRAGYLYPMIMTSASSNPILGPVNYIQGTETAPADYKSGSGFNFGAFIDLRLFKNLYLNVGLEFLYYKYKSKHSGDMNLSFPQTTSYYLKGKGYGSFKEDYTMMSLDIPVMASYRIPVTNKSHLQINAGPVLSLGMSSKLDLTGRTNSEKMYRYKIINGFLTNDRYDNATYKSHINYAGEFNMFSDEAELKRFSSYGNNNQDITKDKMDSAPLNRFNFGLRLGLGYEYMGISLSIHYQWMVTNTANRNFWDGNRWKVLQNTDEYHMTGYSQHNNQLMITVGYTFRY